MKAVTLLGLMLFSLSASAYEVELGTLLGLPNEEMPFVQQVLKAKVPIVSGDNLKDYTTATYYTASRNGIQSAVAVQVLGDNGGGTYADVTLGIEEASKKAAIVLIPIGPQ